LDAPEWLPAPAQGAIAIECRDDDAATRALCAALDHAATRACVEAERAMNLALHGSCHVPVAAFARLQGEHLLLDGLVGSAHDGRAVHAQARGRGDAPESLGLEVAALLRAQGAGELLDAARG
jgi:hydroxymethylbilane synthase